MLGPLRDAARAARPPLARALDGGDRDAILSAVPAVEQRVREGSAYLGARPAVARVRHRLRRLGVTVVPRGPKPTTRTNPAGLIGLN